MSPPRSLLEAFPGELIMWVLIISGVPVLGWLTYLYGPACGVLFLLLGLSLLVWPPVEALRRRRDAGSHRSAH